MPIGVAALFSRTVSRSGVVVSVLVDNFFGIEDTPAHVDGAEHLQSTLLEP